MNSIQGIQTETFSHKGKRVTGLRDSEGRVVVVFFMWHKVYREAYPGQNYGVTAWRGQGGTAAPQGAPSGDTYATRKEAIAAAVAYFRSVTA